MGTEQKTIREGMRGTHIEKIRRRLIKCCYWYYVKADPIINDRCFDTLFEELKSLERIDDPAFYPTPYSPTQMIWGDLEDQYPAWAKVRNRHVLYDDEIEGAETCPKPE